MFSGPWSRLRGLWQRLSGAAPVGEWLDRGVQAQLRQTLAACVAGTGGEVSARQRAAWLGQVYLGLGETGRRAFLKLLLDLEPDPAPVTAAARDWLAADDAAARADAAVALRRALDSPRGRVLRQFNTLPDGVRLLVSMRAELLAWRHELPELRRLDADLYEILVSWFDVGFLSLSRITWQSPAALLEKLVAYEAVHAIRSWTDLRNRLDSDRRCYAFFHPRMPDEPLIFVEVALCQKMADNVQHLLDESLPTTDPADADTAIFYSISTTQPGLRGVSFGNFLIKRVVTELQAEFPGLKTFATLSPMPGFVRWLQRGEAAHGPLSAAERALLGGDEAAAIDWVAVATQHAQAPEAAPALAELLCRLAARYLEQPPEVAGFDPVARFHLGNGARIERLNAWGDTSPNGLAQSCGVMVNYRYDLDAIERNHEAFTSSGEIAVSAAVKRLLRGRRRVAAPS